MTSLVKQPVLDAVEAKKEGRYERKQYTAEEIQKVTDFVRK